LGTSTQDSVGRSSGTRRVTCLHAWLGSSWHSSSGFSEAIVFVVS
jgi:hypothetical protein